MKSTTTVITMFEKAIGKSIVPPKTKKSDKHVTIRVSAGGYSMTVK